MTKRLYTSLLAVAACVLVASPSAAAAPTPGDAVADQPTRIVVPTAGQEAGQDASKVALASTARPERAKEELKVRGPLEPKPLSKVQLALLEYLQPTPLIDGIKEEDKYGNDGERFNRIGRTFVDGVGAFTSFIRSAVDYPMVVLKSISRRVTQALNSVGTRIVGLQ